MKKNRISKNWINKQRRDIYVRQSKVDGYRSRAAYKLIEETYGLPHTYGGKWRYGFQPVQGFPLLYGGVTLKNEWLPKRLQR